MTHRSVNHKTSLLSKQRLFKGYKPTFNDVVFLLRTNQQKHLLVVYVFSGDIVKVKPKRPAVCTLAMRLVFLWGFVWYS